MSEGVRDCKKFGNHWCRVINILPPSLHPLRCTARLSFVRSSSAYRITMEQQRLLTQPSSMGVYEAGSHGCAREEPHLRSCFLGKPFAHCSPRVAGEGACLRRIPREMRGYLVNR